MATTVVSGRNRREAGEQRRPLLDPPLKGEEWGLPSPPRERGILFPRPFRGEGFDSFGSLGAVYIE